MKARYPLAGKRQEKRKFPSSPLCFQGATSLCDIGWADGFLDVAVTETLPPKESMNHSPTQPPLHFQ